MAPFFDDCCAGSFGAYAGPSSAILGLSWDILGPSWCHLGPSWAIWAHPGVILGPCWDHSGRAFRMGIRSVWWFGLSWEILGPSWCHLGPYWAILVSSLGHAGAILVLRFILGLGASGGSGCFGTS